MGLVKEGAGVGANALKNLDVDLNVPEAAHVRKIAPLTLQLLIENAVKHNVIARKKPLYIAISVEQDYLVVKNNLQKKATQASKAPVGLENLKNRYTYISDKSVEIIEDAKFFIVKLPVIKTTEE